MTSSSSKAQMAGLLDTAGAAIAMRLIRVSIIATVFVASTATGSQRPWLGESGPREIAPLYPATSECAWLKKYVEDSASNDGTFPLGPRSLTWSVASPPDVSREVRDAQKAFVTSVINELHVPAAYTENEKDADLFIFFHIKKESGSDTSRIISQLRSSPRLKNSLILQLPVLRDVTFAKCALAYTIPSKTRSRAIDVRVPFNKRTGTPISGASACISEGLLKIVGISLRNNGIARTGWLDTCPQCLEVDRQMAAILSENNRSIRRHISAAEMIKSLSKSTCD